MRATGPIALSLLGTIAFAAGSIRSMAAQSSAGERAFEKCYACHSLEGPDPNTEGPSLKGIVGRMVASEAGFQYSPAMRAYAKRQNVWSRAALDDYIADPQAVVPGNTMGFFGMPDAAEREALIDYLEKAG